MLNLIDKQIYLNVFVLQIFKRIYLPPVHPRSKNITEQGGKKFCSNSVASQLVVMMWSKRFKSFYMFYDVFPSRLKQGWPTCLLLLPTSVRNVLKTRNRSLRKCNSKE